MEQCRMARQENDTTRLFHQRNVEVKTWALRNGFRPDSVYKTIYGLRGKRDRDNNVSARIKAALRRDGFWPEGEAPAEVINR